MTIGWAPSASGADDERKPLVPRRLFDQARPGVELIMAEFTAQLNLPEAEITAANQQALQARVTERIRRGEVAPTETAGRNAAIEELARDPFRWYTRSSRVYREKVKLSAVGSGFSISPDGYIVTNAHVAAPTDKDLKAAFIREALSDQRDAFLQDLGQDGLPPSLAAKYLGALVRWATKTATVSNLKRRLAAVTDSGTSGITFAEGRPAKLITAGKELPGKDVAILKVEASNMATVQLGNDTALGTGDRLFVLGFPAPATFNPVLSRDSQKEPTLTQGVLSAKKTVRQGFTVLQTDAAMTHGNSGGPVFDEQGRVVGVATFGSVDPSTGREVAGLNFAVPVSVVNELLSGANLRPVEGAATSNYRLALDAFDKQWYKRALPLFKQVKALDPAHPSVDRFIEASQAAISQGRDRTPREFLGLPLTLFVVLTASVGLLVVGVLVAVPVRRRRRMVRRRAVAGMSAAQPGPIPRSFPGASRSAPLETRAAGEQRDWLDHQSFGVVGPTDPGSPIATDDGYPGELPGRPPRRRSTGGRPRNRPRSPRRPWTVAWRRDPTLLGSHHRGIGADTSGKQAGMPPGLTRPGPASRPAPPSGGGTAAGGSSHRSSRHHHRWCAGAAGIKARRPCATASSAGPSSDRRNSPAPAGWTRCGLGDDRDDPPRPAAPPTRTREPHSSKSSIPSPDVRMEGSGHARTLAAAAVVAVLTVTGCSGESGGRRAAGPLPAAPTVPTASPTPTSSTAAPLSKQQAAKRYLAIVKPYNLALERLEQAINRGQPVAMVRTLAGQVAVADQAHMRDLRATVWPVEVRALVRELVAESARAQASWRQAARATTRSALIQAVLKAVQHDGSDAPARGRAPLPADRVTHRRGVHGHLV